MLVQRGVQRTIVALARSDNLWPGMSIFTHYVAVTLDPMIDSAYQDWSAQQVMDQLKMTRADILRDYRMLCRARYTDDLQTKWKNDKRTHFAILGGGTEGPQMAAAHFQQKGDWVRGYYRNWIEALMNGTSNVRECLAQSLGDLEPGNDPASGGRMMGNHWGSPLLDAQGKRLPTDDRINRPSDVSSTGSQMPVAFGLAANLRLSGKPGVAWVSIGDSSTSEPIFFGSINQAVVHQAPLVVTVLDNRMGISVPIDQQTAHASISKALSGFGIDKETGKGFDIQGAIPGWHWVDCYMAYQRADQRARETRQPALVHSLVTQPYNHSSSGDRRHKSPEQLAWEAERDILHHMEQWLLEKGVATADEIQIIKDEEHQTVDIEGDAAWRAYRQPIQALAEYVHAVCRRLTSHRDLMNDQTSAVFRKFEARIETNPSTTLADKILHRYQIVEFIEDLLMATRDQCNNPIRTPLVNFMKRIEGEQQALVSSHVYAASSHSAAHVAPVSPIYSAAPSLGSTSHIIAAGLSSMMARDSRIKTFGEDVGYAGGVSAAAMGLQGGMDQIEYRKLSRLFSADLFKYITDHGFGKNRVFDFGIDETDIVGLAIAMALQGDKPIAEIQYLDYAIYALQQVIDELACLRHRTAGRQSAPVIIRTQGFRLQGMWHSGAPMRLFMEPGLFVGTPRDPIQSVGLYRSALMGDDPVLMVDPLKLMSAKFAIPANLAEICVPWGHSEVLRSGSDLSIVTYGVTCGVALQAADALASDGINVEVVDLQTLTPFDVNQVALNSVAKTQRLLVLGEDHPDGVEAMILNRLMKSVGGPSQLRLADVLTSPAHKPAYPPDGDAFSKPQVRHVRNQVFRMLDSLDGGTAGRYGRRIARSPY